jgi:hypothetical protein
LVILSYCLICSCVFVLNIRDRFGRDDRDRRRDPAYR